MVFTISGFIEIIIIIGSGKDESGRVLIEIVYVYLTIGIYTLKQKMKII